MISIAILLVLVVSDIDHTQNRSHHLNGDSVHDHVVDALDPAPDLGYDLRFNSFSRTNSNRTYRVDLSYFSSLYVPLEFVLEMTI